MTARGTVAAEDDFGGCNDAWCARRLAVAALNFLVAATFVLETPTSCRVLGALFFALLPIVTDELLVPRMNLGIPATSTVATGGKTTEDAGVLAAKAFRQDSFVPERCSLTGEFESLSLGACGSMLRRTSAQPLRHFNAAAHGKSTPSFRQWPPQVFLLFSYTSEDRGVRYGTLS